MDLHEGIGGDYTVCGGVLHWTSDGLEKIREAGLWSGDRKAIPSAEAVRAGATASSAAIRPAAPPAARPAASVPPPAAARPAPLPIANTPPAAAPRPVKRIDYADVYDRLAKAENREPEMLPASRGPAKIDVATIYARRTEAVARAGRRD